jgi:hypothetical protein
MRSNLRILVAAMGLFVLLPGCDKPKRSSAQVPQPTTRQTVFKESPRKQTVAVPSPTETNTPNPAPPAPAPSVSAKLASAPANPPQPRPEGPFVWRLPEGWAEIDNAEPMRYATLASADGPDVSISVFPNTAGGNLANMNRWRQQVGLERLFAMDDSLKKETIDRHPVFITDIAGPKGRILAAIVPDKNRTWFFKMQGPGEIVGKQKEAFLQLVRSIKWREGQ